MKIIKAQYLSIDAIIAAIIFIMLVVSLFSFLKFSIFSQQFYESEIDSSSVYISALLFSPYNNGYTLLDTSSNGKVLNSNYLKSSGPLTSLVSRLNKVTPYKVNIIITYYDYSVPHSIKPVINFANVRWASHIRRNIICDPPGENSGPICNVDLYLGVEET